MDQDCVPIFQGCSFTFFVVITLMPFGLFCLKGFCFFMSPLVSLSQLLNKLGCVWLHDGVWSQTKFHINQKVRLSTKHEVVGAEPHG